MEVHLAPELEAKLTESGAQQGRQTDELVQEALARYLAEQARFVEAVRRGEAALDRGDSLMHHQVGDRLRRFLQP